MSEKVFGDGGDKLANEVSRLSEVLYAANDDYDSRVQAQDMLERKNFASGAGGTQWSYDGKAEPGGAPPVPSDDEELQLKKLNEVQRRMDVASRKLKSLSWDLFAEWWKFVSDQANNDPKRQPYRERVRRIREQMDVLVPLIQRLQKSIKEDFKTLPKKQAAGSSFFKRKDPTLCIAGMDSGWPADFLETVKVRLDHQLLQDADKLKMVESIFPNDQSPVPIHNKLRETAQRILAEFIANPVTDTPPAKPGDGNKDAEKPVGEQPNPPKRGFKAWNGVNPFVPLFIEYELIY